MNNQEVLCPVCEIHIFKEIEDYCICPICGWENDEVQTKDKDFSGGANDLSVNQSKKIYLLSKNPEKRELVKELVKNYKEKTYKIYEEYRDIDYTSPDGDRCSNAFKDALLELMSLVEELENEEIY